MPCSKWAILPGLALAWPTASLAATPFTVSVSSQGQIEISSNSCETVTKEVRSLRTWAERLGETTGAFPPVATDASGCTASLTGSVPDFVQEHEGLEPVLNGPNCWNSALVADHILPTIRFARPQEFSFWMSSPLCRPLGPREQAQPGDLIAIRTHYDPAPEVHGMIYVSNDMVFSKKDSSPFTAYALQGMGDVLAEFGIPAGSIDCTGTGGDPAKKCPFFTQYFRCVTLKTYLLGRQGPEFQKYDDAVSGVLDPIGAEIQGFDLSTGMPAASVSSDIQSRLDSLQGVAVSELQTLAQPGSSDPNATSLIFLWNSVQARVASLRDWADRGR